MDNIIMKRGAVCLALAAGLAACGGETGGAKEAEEAAEPAVAATTEVGPGTGSGYTLVKVANGGTIRGTVRLPGTVPPPRTVAVTEDVEVCGESQRVQTLDVGPGRGLANVVVSLLDITQGAALSASASAPALDQRGCRFVPRVLLAPAGAPVHVLNSDPITHNIHTVAFENRPVNRAQPKDLQKIELTFRYAEKVKVRCDIHDWMSAWIVVGDHPYHAVTDREGGFVIPNVPPGTYTLETWHETLGARTQVVSVAAGETVNLSVELTGASPAR